MKTAGLPIRLRILALSLLAAGLVAAAPATAAPTTVQPVCAAAVPGRATCFADRLVNHTNLSPARPPVRRSPAPARSIPTFSPATAVSADAPIAEPQPGTPAYLQQAYDLSYLSQTQGAADTVAVVDAYDDPGAETDLAVYRAEFHLPPCTAGNGCFRKVNQNGVAGTYPAPGFAWNAEETLDLDAISALCPNCRILLVEADNDSDTNMLAAQAQAAALGANQISDSWGIDSDTSPQATFTFPGVQTLAASGDSGYPGAGQNQYPAALPAVTAVGGTTLRSAAQTPTASLRGFTETAWSGAGSGCDRTQTKPSWQHDTGCAGRAWTDISADADPSTGLLVYSAADGGWEQFGGTSLATPLSAAYYALIGARTGPAWAYTHAAELFDPATGTTGACNPVYLCTAEPGYDGPTGAGAISGQVSAGAPGIAGPGPDATYTQNAQPTSAQVSAGIYPNDADTQCFWQYGATITYGQQTPASDAGSTDALTAASATLPGLSPASTYHYRLVAANSYGTSYGYDMTLNTPATPALTVTALSAAVSATSATLTASVNAQGQPSTDQFRWGASTAYGQASTPAPVTGAGATVVQAQLTGLTPDTTYHYTVALASPAGVVTFQDQTFTTMPVLTPAPTIAGLTASAVAQTTATITASVSTGGQPAVYHLSYGDGASASDLTSATLDVSDGDARVDVRGLTPGRTYHASLVAASDGGSTQSAPITFTTAPASADAVNVAVTGVRTHGDRVTLTVRCRTHTGCRVRVQLRFAAGSRTRPMTPTTVRLAAGAHRTVTVAGRLRHGQRLTGRLLITALGHGGDVLGTTRIVSLRG